MLQFVNEIGVKNGFVDLHNHTDMSFGEERNRMNISPVELLDSALYYSKNNNDAPVTFAITDHNNFDSVFEVKEHMSKNPELYKNIRFIKGCEFSCGGGNFGKTVDEKGNRHRIIKGFHVLAYNFNENNKKLKFLSSLYDDSVEKSFGRDGTKISSGRYVLSLRNLLHEDGFYAPLEIFYGIDLTTHKKTQIDFASNLIDVCKEKLDLSDEYCANLLEKLFSEEFYKTFKVEAQEFAEIIEDAGGCIVLAHPKLISFSKSYQTQNASTINQKIKDCEQIKLVINGLKDFVSPYTGKKVRGLVGMEIFCPSTFDFRQGFENLQKIANDNNLYVTCGSDSHGNLLNARFSEVFQRRFSLGLDVNIMAMQSNLFADMICNKTLNKNYTCCLPLEKQVKIVQANQHLDTEMTIEEVIQRNASTREFKPQKERTKNVKPSKPVVKNKNKSHKRKKRADGGHIKIKPFYKSKDKYKKYKKNFELDDDYLKSEKIKKRPSYDSFDQIF